MKKKIGDINGIRRLVRILRSIQPQIIQTWLYHADLIGLIVGRLFTTAKIIWNVRCAVMDFSKYGYTTKLIFLILAKLSRIPHYILFNSEAGRSFHSRSGYSNSNEIIIPNGFDTSLFKPNERSRYELRNQLGIPNTSPVVGMVARFDPMKDHSTFFKAAGITLNRNIDVKFILVGKGLDRKNTQVRQWIKSNGLEYNVYLLGEQKDLMNIYPALDICTLTSYGEGFPNVLGEAMASGIPCVATDVGDSKFIVQDTGIIVPPRDPIALAQAWERLLNLPTGKRQALGKMARHRIESNFSLPIIRNRYLRFYANLLHYPTLPNCSSTDI